MCAHVCEFTLVTAIRVLRRKLKNFKKHFLVSQWCWWRYHMKSSVFHNFSVSDIPVLLLVIILKDKKITLKTWKENYSVQDTEIMSLMHLIISCSWSEPSGMSVHHGLECLYYIGYGMTSELGERAVESHFCSICLSLMSVCTHLLISGLIHLVNFNLENSLFEKLPFQP